jgi:hypothetical protein
MEMGLLKRWLEASGFFDKEKSEEDEITETEENTTLNDFIDNEAEA